MESNNNTLENSMDIDDSFDIIDLPSDDIVDKANNEVNDNEEIDVPIIDKPKFVDDIVKTINTENDNNGEPDISTNPDDLRDAILQMSPEKRELLFQKIAKFQNLQNNMTKKSLKTVEEDNVEDMREKLKMAVKRKKMQRQGKHIKNIEMEKMKSQLQKINDQFKNTSLEQTDTEMSDAPTNETSQQIGDKIDTNLGKAVVLPTAPISTQKAQEVISEISANDLADKMAAELIAEETKNKSSNKSIKNINKRKIRKKK